MNRSRTARHNARNAMRCLLSAALLLEATTLLGCSSKATTPTKDAGTTVDTGAAATDAECANDTTCADAAAAAVCEAGDPASAAACVDPTGYVKDLTFIAAPRTPGSAHHTAVRKMLV